MINGYPEGDYPLYQLQLLEQIVAKTNSWPGEVIEIGCWKGRSAVAIANVIYPQTLICVDTWEGNIDEQAITGKKHPTVVEAEKEDILKCFISNIKQYTKKNVGYYKKHWKDFFEEFEYKDGIKFCHIDASHDYKSVRDNIKALLPLLTDKAIICGDDISSANRGRADLEGGVERAVVELLPGYQRDKNFWWWEK